MNKNLLTLVVFLMYSFSHLSLAKPLLSLDELHELSRLAPSIALDQAELAYRESLLNQAVSASGWEAFGNLSYADMDEYDINSGRRNYDKLAGSLGLSYPLLGSRTAQNLQVDELKNGLDKQRYTLEDNQAKVRLAVRQYYIEYWLAQERVNLVKAFLSHQDQVFDKVRRRKEQGVVRHSKALAMLLPFDQARRDLNQYVMKLKQSYRHLTLLLGSEIPEFDAVEPMLTAVCLDENLLRQNLLDENVELKQAALDITLYQQQLQKQRWSGVQSDFRIMLNANHDDPPGETGSGFKAELTMRMPLSLGGYRSASKKRTGFLLRKAKLKKDLLLNTLSQATFSQLDRYKFYGDEYNFSVLGLRAAQTRLSEERLRLLRMSDISIDDFINARTQYYQAAVETLESQTRLFSSHTNIPEYTNPRCKDVINFRARPIDSIILPLNVDLQGQPKKVSLSRVSNTLSLPANKIQPPKQVSKDYGVYVWNSADFITRSIEDDFINNLGGAFGVNRVLLSLDAIQVNTYLNNPQSLLHLLETLKQKDIAVELLLGEPSWIKPENRYKLMSILKQLEKLPFSGVNLDVEIEQLTEYIDGSVDKSQLYGWLEDTLEQASKATRLALTLSSHYRHFLPENDYCLGCRLAERGVKNIALMMYVTDTEKIKTTLKRILFKHPKLNFYWAVSVERDLNKSNSFYSQGRKKTITQLSAVDDALSRSNFLGVFLQSWKDLIGMDQ